MEQPLPPLDEPTLPRTDDERVNAALKVLQVERDRDRAAEEVMEDPGQQTDVSTDALELMHVAEHVSSFSDTHPLRICAGKRTDVASVDTEADINCI